MKVPPCPQIAKLDKQVAALKREQARLQEELGSVALEKRALFVRLKQQEARFSRALDEAGERALDLPVPMARGIQRWLWPRCMLAQEGRAGTCASCLRAWVRACVGAGLCGCGPVWVRACVGAGLCGCGPVWVRACVGVGLCGCGPARVWA